MIGGNWTLGEPHGRPNDAALAAPAPRRSDDRRQASARSIVGDLLNAGINEKQPRSIKYQFTIAKLPLDVR